ALVAGYVLGKGGWWVVAKLRGEWGVVRGGAHRASGPHREVPLPTPHAVISRRKFLARATYAYAGAGAALSGYGIWSAFRLPEVTRRTLVFRDLPAGLEGLRLLHLSDVHAGIHMERDQMEALDAPRNWKLAAPQPEDVRAALSAAPPQAFKILLAHRPGAWDAAAPLGIPLTLAGHIHGGQLYVPLLGWSAGRLITKYVMGHFQREESQLYVSRGIGVVGVPIRVFVPPEIELFELRRLTA